MTTLSIDSPTLDTLVAGVPKYHSIDLVAGRQYRIDLHGTDTGVGTLDQPATITITRTDDFYYLTKVRELPSFSLPRGTHYFTPDADDTYTLGVTAGGSGSYEIEVNSPTRAQSGIAASGGAGTVFAATAQDDLILQGYFGQGPTSIQNSSFSTIDGGSGFDTLVVKYGYYGFDQWLLKLESGVAWLHSTANFKSVKLTGVEAVETGGGLVYVLDPAHANLPRLYQAALGRAPDLDGVVYYNRVFDGGASLSTIASSFVASPEYKAKYGQLNDAAFVGQLYQNVLGRIPIQAEQTFYTDRLISGEMNREAVLIGFAASPENKNLTGGYIFEV